MPTGYTHGVQEGTVTTFPEFAMTCARAMGALIMMRDDPLDAPIKDFEPSDYHVVNEQKELARLAQLERFTTEEISAAHADECQKAAQLQADSDKRRALEKSRYKAMLEKVNAWMPPTPDFANFKTFMVEQLTESIRWDCGEGYVYPKPNPNIAAWHAEQMQECERRAEYHSDEHEKEVKRTDERNAWVRTLRESLK